jgi:hypothetical protein
MPLLNPHALLLHTDNPCNHRILPEEGQSNWQQDSTVCTLLLPVLLLVPREVYEISEQECLHTDSAVLNKLLQEQ